MLNVDPRKLRKGSVPMRCAKTGAPTTRLRRQWVLDTGDASYWWILWSLGIYLLIRACRSSAVLVELPIAPEVARRYRTWLMARRLGVVGVFALTAAVGGSLLVFAAAWGAWAVLHLRTRREWVTARWNGTFVRLDAHPDLMAALREPTRPAFVPAGLPPTPAPGWYADPTGRDTVRYWDGGAWTEHVAAYPA